MPAPITDFDGAMDVVVTHCVTAAASLTSPITDVQRGDPLPKGRCGRIWYGGEDDPPSMAGNRVLNGEIVGEVIHIDFFWPISVGSETPAKSRDIEVRALKHALRTAILADSTLGGKCMDLLLTHAQSQFVSFDNTAFRTLELELTLSYVEYTTS